MRKNSETSPNPTTPDSNPPDTVDEILSALAEDLINYDQRMTDANAPNIRFVHEYNQKAKAAINAHIRAVCEEVISSAKPDIEFDRPEGIPNTLAVDFTLRHLAMYKTRLHARLNELLKGKEG